MVVSVVEVSVVEVPMVKVTIMMMVVVKHKEIEIVQNEESWEKEPRVPEGIGNPRIQIAIIVGRRIIANDWRTFLVVIIVDVGRRHIWACLRGLILRILIRRRRDRHSKLRCDLCECL